jgi:prepilin-type N-terminal cleavage/methylation domain-containing protein
MTTHRYTTRRGFTLVEVLIALGLFAIGMIAVASLFPVAALLQKETAEEVVGEHAAQSAKSIVEAKRLTYRAPTGSGLAGGGDLGRYHTMAGKSLSRAIPLHVIDPDLLVEKYTYWDRSFPSGTPAPADRDLFWVPFIQNVSGDKTNPNWVMRLFLLVPDARATYPVGQGFANPGDPDFFPKITAVGCSVKDDTTFTLDDANHGLEGGDLFMDSNGTDYQVAEVDGADVSVLGRILVSPEAPVVVWYAPAFGGSGSPTQRIVTVKIDVPQP